MRNSIICIKCVFKKYIKIITETDIINLALYLIKYFTVYNFNNKKI